MNPIRIVEPFFDCVLLDRAVAAEYREHIPTEAYRVHISTLSKLRP
jgi:hypothetical protein